MVRYKALLRMLVQSEKLDFGNALKNNLAKSSGVYRVVDRSDSQQKTIYIGQAKNLQRRVFRNHYAGSAKVSTFRKKLIKYAVADETTISDYLRKCCVVQLIVIEDKPERIGFEHFAVAVLQPNYND